MAKIEFKVSIDPVRAYNLVKQNSYAELVDQELKDLGGGKYIGVLVFEKYYMRVSSRASLVVLIDNTNGNTHVKAIGSGAGTGMIFKFDWGASDSFANSVRKILEDFIV